MAASPSRPFSRVAHRLAGLLLAGLAVHALADGPPSSNGVISNPTLVANQSVAAAQAAGVITTFMGTGAQECDTNGKNCHSVFGSDDSVDYSGLQTQAQSITGVQSSSFASGDASIDPGDTNTISTQTSSLAIACRDTTPKVISGIAIKLTSCQVNTQGDAKISFSVCTAPSRGNPVTPPAKVMDCSTDPSSPDFTPKAGYSCRRPTCDTEPMDSQNGWSSPTTISWSAATAAAATTAANAAAAAASTAAASPSAAASAAAAAAAATSTAAANAAASNGLGLVFSPPLSGGSVASLTSDSDTMEAVKVVQTFINNQTLQTAVGLKVAFRYKSTVTKDMMIQGQSAVPNPGANTAQWDTILKLNGNAAIPQYQKTYAANGSTCIQQIQNGIGKDGVISVCDQSYTNESGIKPIAKTATVAAEGQDCGTTSQCLSQVVNTNTWTQSCNADVPLSMRKCTTKQDYTMETLSYTRTRTTEVCTEARAIATYTCQTKSTVGAAETVWAPASDLTFAGSTGVQTMMKYVRTFTTPKATQVVSAQIGTLWVDNWGEIRLNGTRIWARYDNNLGNVLNGDMYNNCDNETWTESYYDDNSGQYVDYPVTGVMCTMSDGTRQQANYSDACSGLCANQQTVNLAIPMNLVKLDGDNTITMACFNNLGRSECNFTINLEYLNISKYTVDDSQCAPYETTASP